MPTSRDEWNLVTSPDLGGKGNMFQGALKHIEKHELDVHYETLESLHISERRNLATS